MAPIPPFSSSPVQAALPKLQQASAWISLLLLPCVLTHLFFARLFRGNKRGNSLSFFVIVPTYITATLTLCCVLSILALFIHRLITDPSLALLSNNDIVLSFLSILALSYSGLLGHDRRRRNVAVLLAKIPCFGNGDHSSSHQLLVVEKSPMLCFAPQFIAPQTVSFDRNTEPSNGSQPSSLDKPRVTSTVGITKNTFLEISCRTAHTWVFGRPKRQAWPLNVVRTYRSIGKRFVLIKDQTVQDGAGTVLMTPTFLQSDEIDKLRIARVIHEAMYRSAPCILHSVTNKFDAALFDRFAQLPAIICMLTGDLRHQVQKRSSRPCTSTERCYVTEMLWAIVVVEVLDYLQHKRRDLPMLKWYTNLPSWLCQNDGSTIDREIDRVFEAWKAGRRCGKSMLRPCDTECCCHSSFSHTGCGCQCPCVCNCP